MDQNEYPRPDAVVGGVYPKDKTWGIVIIVLSALGLCGSLMLGAGGAVLGAAGASGALAQSGANAGGRDVAAGAGAMGGLFAILGFVLAAFCLAQLIGGVGILKSARWGFMVTGGFAALNILGSLTKLPSSIIGIAISGVILYYCYSRITGKIGPVPV